MKRKILAIIIEGGLVQDVVANAPLDDVDVLVIDYDTEGADPEDYTQVEQSDGTEADAFVSSRMICPAAIDLAAIAARLYSADDCGDCDDGQGPRQDYSTGAGECEAGID